MIPPIFIHVGFCNTGTTSLQQNFFAKRDGIFFAGTPYRQCGGIFTEIKSIEDFKFDERRIKDLCEEWIFSKCGDRTIVISDETLCDSPQLYFAPFSMPRDVIARRLRRFFPTAKIIFTIPDQRHYLSSMYLNIKRNYAMFDHLPMPHFSEWLGGMMSQLRCHFAQNVNFMESIRVYANIFGRQNIVVLPLEAIAIEGPQAYLGKLCQFMGLQAIADDSRNFAVRHNQRMTTRLQLAAELLPEDRFRSFFEELIEGFGSEQLEAFLDEGPRATIDLSAADEALICNRIGTGNWLLAHEFDLDLKRYGYPMVDDSEFSRELRALAMDEVRLAGEMDDLYRSHDAECAARMRLTAEIVSLRARLVEFAMVTRSPVWRAVSLLDRARRLFFAAPSPH